MDGNWWDAEMQLTTSLPKEVVETQLARIIGSRQFCNAPRLSRFLTYVVEEFLAGRTERLKGYTVGLAVFDKPEDFDPQTDTLVRVQARALRLKLDQYYAQDGRDDPIHITIPKGSYDPSFYVSWDGEKLADLVSDPPAAGTDKPSIAVLPFDNFSQRESNGFVSSGITEEVIANLSRFRDLAVFSRSTAEKIKFDHLSISQTHRSIGADFVVEGSVRADAKFTDITVNLIDAAKDEIILTEHFRHETTPDAVYQMQDKMALEIAATIADRFGPLGQYAERAARSGRAQKWETYYWISRYHQSSIQLSPVARQEVKEGLIKTLESDPGSSDAHAVLSLIVTDEYRMTDPDSSPDDSPDDLPDQAYDEAQKAVLCDPQSAIAQEALATAYFHQGEFQNFDRAAKNALRLNPGHADMLARLGLCYGARANWAVALPMLYKAIALNPVYPGWYRVMRAIGFCMTKSPEEAVAELQISPLPGIFFYHCNLVWFLVETGDMEAASVEKRKLLDLIPDFERFIVKHYALWRVDNALAKRAFSAWRKIGLIHA